LRLRIDGQHLVAVGYVANAQADKIALAQLAIDGEVDHRQIAHVMGV
jgi:hypothetical protein